MSKVSAALAAVAISVLLFAAGGNRTVSSANLAECGNTSTGHIALTDLGSGTFQGEQGGLYPGGSNISPAAYTTAGIKAGSLVVPRDGSGNPSAAGKIAFVAIGMSNTEAEFNALIQAERSDSRLNPAVGFVNGGEGGMTAVSWANQGGVKGDPWPILESRISAAGFTDAQVQVIWLKEADFTFNNPSFETYAQTLSQELSQIASIAAQRYPNLRQVFVSARTYGGYSGIYPTTTSVGPNPEPWAYETGFADKWFVAKSVASPSQRPWVGWGPYFWTDGTKGRADGLQWLCSDTADGTHPSLSGLAKITPMLRTLFATSVLTPWFGGSAPVANPSPTSRPVTSPLPTPLKTPLPTAGSGGLATPAGNGSASPAPTVVGVPGALNATLVAVEKLPPAERWVVALVIAGLALTAFAFIFLRRPWRIRLGVRRKGTIAAGTNGSGPPGSQDAAHPEEPPRVLVGTGSAVRGQGEDEAEPGL